MRVALLGGTFDPPHIGHWLAAVDAFEALDLDRLVFVPAARQPLKQDRETAPAAARLAMLRAMAEGDPRFAVDPIELERPGLSYTVDTLEEIVGNNTGAEIFLLIGEDTLAGFSGWKKHARIREIATIAVMRRAGAPRTGESMRSDGVVELSARRIDVSSTEIRERLKSGKSIKGFVPESVERFITMRRLYS